VKDCALATSSSSRASVVRIVGLQIEAVGLH
jgi:hypothetical protein